MALGTNQRSYCIDRSVESGMVNCTIRGALASDVLKIAAVYREAFPRHLKSRLGSFVIRRYLRAVIHHPCYRVLLADEAGTVIGFSVLHLDRRRSIGHWWVFPRPLGLCLGEVQTLCFGRQPVSGPGALSDLSESSWLDFIGVSGSSRGKGCGKRLLEACKKMVVEDGKCELKLTVECGNKPAIQLYEGCGFMLSSVNPAKGTRIYTWRRDDR